jgi:hypothetical protein
MTERTALALALTLLVLPTRPASPAEGRAPGAQVGRYRVDGRTIERDGKPSFLVGVNYIPPREWLGNLRSWDADAVEADMAALERLGVRTIRWFPLWPLTQPAPGTIDETVLGRVDEVVRLAGRHRIDVQISPLTGWMSGYFVLPPWARGDVFADPAALAAEQRLVERIASRYRDNPAVQGFDFGNELNVLVEFISTKATVPEMETWMDSIYRTFKAGSPEKLVTNGIGTGFTKEFEVGAISRTSDYVSVHSYPGVHRTGRMDPYLGQRTTYSVNYMVEWAATTGKPVLVQETGASNTEVTDADMSRILSVTMASSWAEGAAGYFWWCSHDNSPSYRIPEDLVWREKSLLKDLKTGEMMGLLTSDNREKGVGRRYRELGATLESLGVGWVPRNPVVYVLVPASASADFWGSMIELVQPFVLAKQTHAKVRFLRQQVEVPRDAAAVIVPGFALSPEARRPLETWLRAGGRVFQSEVNDFSPDIAVGAEHVDPAPLVWATSRLGPFASDQYVRLPATAIREVTAKDDVEVLARHLTEHEHPRKWHFGKPLFCRANVGSGSYYYLGAALEKAYVTAWSPWEKTDGHAFYAALVPEAAVEIDNKLVELAHLARGGEEMVVLINHSGEFQDVAVSVPEGRTFTGVQDPQRRLVGRETRLRLVPSEVALFRSQPGAAAADAGR